MLGVPNALAERGEGALARILGPRRGGACIVEHRVKKKSSPGMRAAVRQATHRRLGCEGPKGSFSPAAAALPRLVPPSAVAWDLLPLEAAGWLWRPRRSAPRRSAGASECPRSEGGDGARGRPPGGRMCPYSLFPNPTPRSRSPPRSCGGEVRVSVTVVPSAGLMRVGDRELSPGPCPARAKRPTRSSQPGLRPARRIFFRAWAWTGSRSPASMRSSNSQARPPRRRRATAPTFGSSRWAAAR